MCGSIAAPQDKRPISFLHGLFSFAHSFTSSSSFVSLKLPSSPCDQPHFCHPRWPAGYRTLDYLHSHLATAQQPRMDETSLQDSGYVRQLRCAASVFDILQLLITVPSIRITKSGALKTSFPSIEQPRHIQSERCVSSRAFCQGSALHYAVPLPLRGSRTLTIV